MQHGSGRAVLALPALWAAGDLLYRWKAARLRFRRYMLRLWPLWLALLAINMAESPARLWLDGDGGFYALWNQLHAMGLGLAGAVAALIMAGLMIESYIATSARTQ